MSLLTSCVVQQTQFFVPKSIRYQNQTFEKITHSQLDEMQHLLYLPKGSKQDPENWQQGILIFLDKNSQRMTLADRVTLRRNSFSNQTNTFAELNIHSQELQSQVIYPPTERFQNIQFEVTRGRDLDCGYGQMQWVSKRSDYLKNLQDVTKFQPLVSKMAQDFSLLAWQIVCR